MIFRSVPRIHMKDWVICSHVTHGRDTTLTPNRTTGDQAHKDQNQNSQSKICMVRFSELGPRSEQVSGTDCLAARCVNSNAAKVDRHTDAEKK